MATRIMFEAARPYWMQLAQCLDPPTTSFTHWEALAYELEFKIREITHIKNLDHQSGSNTIKLFEQYVERTNGGDLFQVKQALRKLEREDALQILNQHDAVIRAINERENAPRIPSLPLPRPDAPAVPLQHSLTPQQPQLTQEALLQLGLQYHSLLQQQQQQQQQQQHAGLQTQILTTPTGQVAYRPSANQLPQMQQQLMMQMQQIGKLPAQPPTRLDTTQRGYSPLGNTQAQDNQPMNLKKPPGLPASRSPPVHVTNLRLPYDINRRTENDFLPGEHFTRLHSPTSLTSMEMPMDSIPSMHNQSLTSEPSSLRYPEKTFPPERPAEFTEVLMRAENNLASLTPQPVVIEPTPEKPEKIEGPNPMAHCQSHGPAVIGHINESQPMDCSSSSPNLPPQTPPQQYMHPHRHIQDVQRHPTHPNALPINNSSAAAGPTRTHRQMTPPNQQKQQSAFLPSHALNENRLSQAHASYSLQSTAMLDSHEQQLEKPLHLAPMRAPPPLVHYQDLPEYANPNRQSATTILATGTIKLEKTCAQPMEIDNQLQAAGASAATGGVCQSAAQAMVNNLHHQPTDMVKDMPQHKQQMLQQHQPMVKDFQLHPALVTDLQGYQTQVKDLQHHPVLLNKLQHQQKAAVVGNDIQQYQTILIQQPQAMVKLRCQEGVRQSVIQAGPQCNSLPAASPGNLSDVMNQTPLKEEDVELRTHSLPEKSSTEKEFPEVWKVKDSLHTWPLTRHKQKIIKEVKQQKPPESQSLVKKENTHSVSVDCNFKQATYKKKPVKVLLTYTVSEADHKKMKRELRVLYNCLLKNNFAPSLDFMEEQVFSRDMGAWMNKRFGDANFVLACITPQYKHDVDQPDDPLRKTPNRYSMCCRYIHIMMRNEFVHGGSRNKRFLPVLFPGSATEDMPMWMRGSVAYKWREHWQDIMYNMLEPKDIMTKIKGNKEKFAPVIKVTQICS